LNSPRAPSNTLFAPSRTAPPAREATLVAPPAIDPQTAFTTSPAEAVRLLADVPKVHVGHRQRKRIAVADARVAHVDVVDDEFPARSLAALARAGEPGDLGVDVLLDRGEVVAARAGLVGDDRTLQGDLLHADHGGGQRRIIDREAHLAQRERSRRLVARRIADLQAADTARAVDGLEPHPLHLDRHAGKLRPEALDGALHQRVARRVEPP